MVWRIPIHDLHPVDALLTEQAFRAEEQEYEREHVREPPLDAAADVGAEVDLRQLFTRPDDQPADDRARDRFEAAEDQYRQGLERKEGERVLHAVARAPQQPRDKRDKAGDRPDDA